MLAIVGLASCVTTADQYVCTLGDPSACVRDGVQGQCEATRNCSFPDPTCGAPGFRYDASAQLGRAGVCVLSAGGASVTQPQPIGAGEPLLFEITTPMQTIVFDTEAPGTTAHTQMSWFASPCPPTGAMEPVTDQSCPMNQLATRVSVDVIAPGPHCLVVQDLDTGPASVALRTYPSVAAPSCAW